MRLSQRCCVESGVIFGTIGKMEESTNRVTSMKQLKVLRFHSPSDVMLLHHKFPLPQKKNCYQYQIIQKDKVERASRLK